MNDTTKNKPLAPASGSPTGWWNPEPWRNTSKWHWVTETGRTLCGRYAYIRGDLAHGNDDSGDNCSACRKKRQKANAEVSDGGPLTNK